MTLILLGSRQCKDFGTAYIHRDIQRLASESFKCMRKHQQVENISTQKGFMFIKKLEFQ